MDPNIPVDRRGQALHRAAWDGAATCVELLLEASATVNAVWMRGTTALHLSALQGHTAALQALLTRRAGLQQRTLDGANALHFAAQNGHKEATATRCHGCLGRQVTQLLLDLSCCMETERRDDGARPLHNAAYEGHAEVLQLLLKSRAQSLKQRFQALHGM